MGRRRPTRASFFESIAYQLRRRIGLLLPQRQIIFLFDAEHSGADPLVANSEGLTVRCFENANEVSRNWAEISAGRTISFAEFSLPFGDHAVLWMAMQNDLPFGYLWTARARDLRHWHIALNPDDVVIYSVTVFAEYRGLGLAPAATRLVAERDWGADAGVYLDCAWWNTSAHRAFSKAGFRRVGQTFGRQITLL
jgi:GNAT superfamily N-acetyltransferase